MEEIKKEDAKNFYNLIEQEARERQRLETERRQKLKEIFNRSSSNPFDRIKGENL
jgi:hypothetical protein